MKRTVKWLSLLVATILTLAITPNVHAYSLGAIEGLAASGGVLQHPESGTQFDGYSGTCTSSDLTDCYWDLGESAWSAWFVISTDHYDPTPTDYFDFDIYSSADMTSWSPASFTGRVFRVMEEPPAYSIDTDDYALLYSFSSTGRYIRAVDIMNTHRTGLYHSTNTCADGATGLSKPCSMSGVEWDGVAVPEPGTLILFGSGLLGLGFVRRRLKG